MLKRFGIAGRHSALAIVGFALAGIIGAGPISVAAAAPISIINFSFEDPAQGDGGFNNGPVTGWVVTGVAGVFDPTVGQLGQGPTDGLQVGYSNNVGLGLTQTLAALLTANTQYTLTVDVQSRTDGFPEIGSTLELRTALGDLLASSSVGPIAAGTNALLSTSFFASSSDSHLGQALEIRLLAAGAQSDWDNVRLDATPRTSAVPEPGTLLLLGAGLAGLGVLRRKF